MPGYKAVCPEAVEKGLNCEDCKLVLRHAVQLTRDGTLLCESCYEQRYATMASFNLKLQNCMKFIANVHTCFFSSKAQHTVFFCGSYKAIATFARVYTALSACYSSPSLFYFLHREGNADQEVCSKQNFFCICVSNVVWHCTYDMAGLYRVYMQVFPDKARRREVRFIEVHCDDARCSWTGNAGELEVPIFFSRVTSDHHDTLRG